MKLAGQTTYIPQCCPNGNYAPYQTRGMYAYCVDVNGNQDGEAVPITDVESLWCGSLSC